MKMQKLFSILLFCLMLGSGSLMAQSMSDSQVLEYVKDGIRQGKEQKQLASELARKGVCNQGTGNACEAAVRAAEQCKYLEINGYGHQ